MPHMRRHRWFAAPVGQPPTTGINSLNTRINTKRTTMERTNEQEWMTGMDRDERWVGRLRVIGWSLIAVLLLLPAVAMLYTDEVQWSAGDFLLAAVLLIGTGLLGELVLRRSRNNAYRAGAAVALVATLLLAWSNAAVGFVGAGANAANILYVALIGLVMAASFAAGFQARGMARAMVAAAIGQGLVMALAFSTELVRSEETFVIIVINGFFMALWSTAAVLFDRAAQGTALSIKLRLLLPVLLTATGFALLGYMVVVEGEPGALPLLVVIGGLGWALVTVLRARSRRK